MPPRTRLSVAVNTISRFPPPAHVDLSLLALAAHFFLSSMFHPSNKSRLPQSGVPSVTAAARNFQTPNPQQQQQRQASGGSYPAPNGVYGSGRGPQPPTKPSGRTLNPSNPRAGSPNNPGPVASGSGSQQQQQQAQLLPQKHLTSLSGQLASQLAGQHGAVGAPRPAAPSPATLELLTSLPHLLVKYATLEEQRAADHDAFEVPSFFLPEETDEAYASLRDKRAKAKVARQKALDELAKQIVDVLDRVLADRAGQNLTQMVQEGRIPGMPGVPPPDGFAKTLAAVQARLDALAAERDTLLARVNSLETAHADKLVQLEQSFIARLEAMEKLVQAQAGSGSVAKEASKRAGERGAVPMETDDDQPALTPAAIASAAQSASAHAKTPSSSLTPLSLTPTSSQPHPLPAIASSSSAPAPPPHPSTEYVPKATFDALAAELRRLSKLVGVPEPSATPSSGTSATLAAGSGAEKAKGREKSGTPAASGATVLGKRAFSVDGEEPDSTAVAGVESKKEKKDAATEADEPLSLAQRLRAVDQRVGKVEGRMTKVEDEETKSRVTVQSLSDRCKTVEGDVRRLNTAQATLKSATPPPPPAPQDPTLRPDLDALSARLTALSAQLAALPLPSEAHLALTSVLQAHLESASSAFAGDSTPSLDELVERYKRRLAAWDAPPPPPPAPAPAPPAPPIISPAALDALLADVCALKKLEPRVAGHGRRFRELAELVDYLETSALPEFQRVARGWGQAQARGCVPTDEELGVLVDDAEDDEEEQGEAGAAAAGVNGAGGAAGQAGQQPVRAQQQQQAPPQQQQQTRQQPTPAPQAQPQPQPQPRPNGVPTPAPAAARPAPQPAPAPAATAATTNGGFAGSDDEEDELEDEESMLVAPEDGDDPMVG
ncbi:hypothetical protein JCM8097_002732 [Rhodosporidiobolus ruineniae]